MPFGTFDVPVVATIGGVWHQVWIDVEDDTGSFEHPGVPSKVKPDPTVPALSPES